MTATPRAGLPDAVAVTAIARALHGDPFAILGPHDVEDGCAVRTFVPGVESVDVVARDCDTVLAPLHRVEGTGFYYGVMPSRVPYRLRITSGGAVTTIEDAYSFGPSLGEMDIYLLAEGRHREIGRALGAHLIEHEGIPGVRFAVWAPNARRVSVVGSFNHWDGRRHPMRFHIGAGVWEIFIPRLGAGTVYKYELLGPGDVVLPLKADPVAAAAERPPATASIVIAEALQWTDESWRAHRAQTVGTDAPISIYEVHGASWRPAAEGGVDGWTNLADQLVPYVVDMGFSHVELMPIMEHPFGGSWGYQPLGQFAPSARLGPPDAFARFVDRCHAAGIGVILDWVPAHFPSDAHGLAHFDGTSLYEHQDPREGYHQDWGTFIYNLGRNEVRGFLIGSALHWLEHYHADGLRVDAVASMLYRDYSRKAGEWIPNQYGGRENLEAVSFLRELSQVVRERCPGTVLIAEESTAWPGVSRSVEEGELGFNFKWNMGWMHDTLHYMHEDAVHRRWHHDNMTFGLVYAFSENFVLPLSHDEVVYGKGSLLAKMPGDAWQQFSNLRAYYGFMWTHPGKKLLFMGGEIAQGREWDHDQSVDWHQLEISLHAGVQNVVRDLNRLYRETPALHRHDCDGTGFHWAVIDDRDQSVFAYLRFGDANDPPALVVSNFTPVPRHDYRVGVPRAGFWREAMNTDAGIYGGSNMGNDGGAQTIAEPRHDQPASLSLTLPPLSTIVLIAV